MWERIEELYSINNDFSERNFLIFYNIPVFLEIDVWMPCICSFHVKLESIVTPKNFVEFFSIKRTWQLINCFLSKNVNRKQISRIPVEGNIVEDNRKIADHFNDYFINVGPKLAQTIPPSNRSFMDFFWEIAFLIRYSSTQYLKQRYWS